MHPHTYRFATAAVVLAGIVIAAGCRSDGPAQQAASPAAGDAAQPAPGAQPGPAASKNVAPATGRPQARQEAPPPAAPRTVTLAAGTALAVRTTSALSTKSNEAGQPFEATLEKPVVVNGREVLPRGAAVTGRIVKAEAGGRVRGVASIALGLRSITAGGQTYSIATNTVSRQAKSTKKKDAAKVGIGAGIGAAIGAIAGGGRGAAIGAAAGGGAGTAAVVATRGDAAEVPAESVLTFRLTAPVAITAGP